MTQSTQYSPLFSLVIPVWHPDPAEFVEALDSIFDQYEPEWQLVLVSDGPQPEEVVALLDGAVERAHASPKREVLLVQREEQGGIVAATNDGIAQASGEFIAFMDNDDVLTPRALLAFRQAIEAFDDVDAVYSDEDKIDPEGNLIGAFHKPGWSPDRLRSHNFLTHFNCFRRSVIDQVGGLRIEFDGSQDHDLSLRVTEKARRISHVPEVLYHWRQSAGSVALDPANKDWAFEAGVGAVQDHLDRVGIPATASRDNERSGGILLAPNLPSEPAVSIVMASRGAVAVGPEVKNAALRRSIGSIVNHTTYRNYEIVVVLDQDTNDAHQAAVIEAGQNRVRFVHDSRAFSASSANNLGASAAGGEHLVFLSADAEVVTPEWLQRLVLFSSLAGVGAVGARVEQPDGRIRHAGITTRDGLPAPLYAGYPGTSLGLMGALWLTFNTLAVSNACMMIKRSAFDAAGGFSSHFPHTFADVDLCLKSLSLGYRTVIDNRTQMIEAATLGRARGVEPWEADLLRTRWASILDNNPFDNPNLSQDVLSELGLSAGLLAKRRLVGIEQPARSWSMADSIHD